MIIGITGLIGSGKDTVTNFFVNRGCVRDSFASPLKDVCASIFGWERADLEGDTVDSRDFRETPDMFWTRKLGIDNFTPRLALQLMGTEVMRNHFHENIVLAKSLFYGKSTREIIFCPQTFQRKLIHKKSLRIWFSEKCYKGMRFFFSYL